MTLEDRFAIIEKKAIQDKIELLQKQNEDKLQKRIALNKIKELSPRIKDLIALGNKCLKEEVPFPKNTFQFGYGKTFLREDDFASYGFVAFCDDESEASHLGFIRFDDNIFGNNIEYLGIAYSGNYVFCTNGDIIALKNSLYSNIDIGLENDINLYELNGFLNEFEQFESSFYKWIDSLAKELEEPLEENILE